MVIYRVNVSLKADSWTPDGWMSAGKVVQRWSFDIEAEAKAFIQGIEAANRATGGCLDATLMKMTACAYKSKRAGS